MDSQRRIHLEKTGIRRMLCRLHGACVSGNGGQRGHLCRTLRRSPGRQQDGEEAHEDPGSHTGKADSEHRKSFKIAGT